MMTSDEMDDRPLPESVIDALAESVWRSPDPRVVFDALSARQQREVAARLVARSEFMRFLTVTWAGIGVLWVWLVAVSGWEMPALLRAVSAVALVVLLLSSGAQWWLRSGVLHKLRITDSGRGE